MSFLTPSCCPPGQFDQSIDNTPLQIFYRFTDDCFFSHRTFEWVVESTTICIEDVCSLCVPCLGAICVLGGGSQVVVKYIHIMGIVERVHFDGVAKNVALGRVNYSKLQSIPILYEK